MEHDFGCPFDDGKPDGHDFPLNMNYVGVTDEDLKKLNLSHLKGRRRNATMAMIACILVANRSGQKTSYSRNSNHYPGLHHCFGPLHTFKRITDAVDILNNAGLIGGHRQKPFHFGWQSWMVPTLKLLIIDDGVRYFTNHPHEIVCLKNTKKKYIPMVKDDNFYRMEKEVRILNRTIAERQVSVPNARFAVDQNVTEASEPYITLTQIILKRIFNRDLLHGGRVFASYMNYPRSLRKKMLLDGVPVAEPDHKNLHPQLLYAKLGKHLSGDAYTVPGFDREDAKVAWNIMINSANRQAAVHAFIKSRSRGEHSGSESVLEIRRTNRLFDALAKRHESVKDAFYTGIGLELQFLDSELQMKILARCYPYGVYPLPVHDSFIVQIGREEKVIRIWMKWELRSLLRKLRRGEIA